MFDGCGKEAARIKKNPRRCQRDFFQNDGFGDLTEAHLTISPSPTMLNLDYLQGC